MERVLLRWGGWVVVGWFVALNFVHPLRAALRLHASPSLREGEVCAQHRCTVVG